MFHHFLYSVFQERKKKDGYLTYYLFQDDAIYTKAILAYLFIQLNDTTVDWLPTNKGTFFRFNPVPQNHEIIQNECRNRPWLAIFTHA